MQSVAPAASCLTNAGEVQSHAVYPLASKVALNPPDGKDDASGSPLINSFPEKLAVFHRRSNERIVFLCRNSG